MSVKVEHPSVSDRRARGKEAGNERLLEPCRMGACDDSPDPVALLEE